MSRAQLTYKPLGGRDENDADDSYGASAAERDATAWRATEVPQNPTELLAYYRDRIALFNQERHEYAQKLEDCAVSREEYYKLRWELNQRDTEIAELQKALSDAHVYLYDEREHVLQLQAECDELKVQELEDRRRIQHLLALTQPVTQEVTYFRDCRPTAVTRVAAGAATADAAFATASASTRTRAQHTLDASIASAASAASATPSHRSSAKSLGSASSSASKPSAGVRPATARAPGVGGKTAGRSFLPSSISASASTSSLLRGSGGGVPVYRPDSARHHHNHDGNHHSGDEGSEAPEGGMHASSSGAGIAVRPRSATSASKCDHCGKATSIIRTIYLPNENADSMKTIVESLRRQLAEHAKLAAEQKAAFQEDRRIREQEAQLHVEAYKEKIARLEEAMRAQHDTNHRTMRDYFRLRHELRSKEEQALTEHTLAKERIDRLQYELDNFDNSAEIKAKAAHARMRIEHQEYTDQFRKQVLDREENACIIKEQYAATQKMYQTRVDFLDAQNASLKDKCRQLERRRALQAEGFGSEITQVCATLRAALKTLERRLLQARLTARHRTEEARLTSEPEFIAVEERMQRIAEQLRTWVGGRGAEGGDDESDGARA